MFSQLRDRVAAKLRDLGPQDELDKAISAVVDRGTAETLQAPDWSANMELVDVVNRNPEVTSEKLLRVVNRAIAKPAVRTQVLALTMLDTCVRNCHPVLHTHLAQSLLWADLLKLVQDKSVSRIDLEVRDKILSMVEDYGRYLAVTHPSFGEAYDALVDQGVDFPVRAADEIVPIEVQVPPPPLPSQLAILQQGNAAPGAPAPGAAAAATAGGSPPPQQQQQQGVAAAATGFFSNLVQSFAGAGTTTATGTPAAGGAPGAAAAAAAAAAPTAAAAQRAAAGGRRGGPAAPAFDPSVLEGLSEEDRRAVEAAMADMALESEAAQEAAAIAASLQTAAAEQQAAAAAAGGVPQLPTSTSASDQAAGAAGAGEGAAAAVPPPGAAVVGHGSPARGRREQQQQPQVVALPADNEAALQVISNSVSVFGELVLSIPDEEAANVRDPLIRELADQCQQYRSRLMSMVGEVADEAVLQQALAQNDVLTTAMSRYDALLAQALSSPLQPHISSPASDTAARAAAATTAIVGGAAAAAGTNFTLIDEEEEEDPGQALATRRQEPTPAAPAAAAPAAQADPLADLLGDLPTSTAPATGQQPAPHAAPPPPPSEPLI